VSPVNGSATQKSAQRHVCVVYDCLFPWTIGGAERWYRALAEYFAKQGHCVTYLTLQQWEQSDPPRIDGVDVIAVGPRLALYNDERRRIWPTIRFGWGVLLHLLRHGGRYDHVHMASFPFFSVLAAGILRRWRGYSLGVDWHEVWTKQYWRDYLGPMGIVGWAVQSLCARYPHSAFTYSRLHQSRLEALGRSAEILPGEYIGESYSGVPPTQPLTLVYAGRLIPEKRVPLLIEAYAIAVRALPELRLRIFGKGPERDKIGQLIERLDLDRDSILSGFVEEDELHAAMMGAAAIVQPSMREGYGMVVAEASARGVPAIVVEAADNAAVELIEIGVNGMVAEASADGLAKAILTVCREPDQIRQSTRDWYRSNAERLSVKGSLEIVAKAISPER